MSAFEIDMLSGGSPLGFGPLTTVQSWTVTDELDQAGDLSFDLPRADPASDLLAERVSVRCATLPRGSPWTTIGAGVIETLTEDMQGSALPVLDVSGHGRLIELADRTVGDLRLTSGASGESPMPAASLLAAIMAYAPAGWTTTGTPSEDVYLAFAGETVLGALGKLAAQLGDHFRAGSGAVVEWLPKTTAPAASGIRAVSALPNPSSLDATTCLISQVTRKRDASQRVTRIYAYGGGNAGARTTLAGATYTLPAGYSYGSETISTITRYFIKHDAYDAAGRIDAEQSFSDVSAIDETTGHRLSAANALAQAAAVWLTRHVEVYYSYDVDVTALAVPLRPGQTLRIVADHFVAGRRVPIVDADLLILGVRSELASNSSLRVVSLTLATSDRWPEDDTRVAAATSTRQQTSGSHLQVAQRATQATTVTGITLAPGATLTVNRPMTLDASADGFTATLPATGTMALRGTANDFTAAQTITVTDAGTTTAPTMIGMAHRSSGTPGAGFGVNFTWRADSSTNTSQLQGSITSTWIVATDASRTARVRFFANDWVQSREFLRGEGDGTAARIGFLGATAIARPSVTGAKGGNAALTSLLTALASLGLITDSST